MKIPEARKKLKKIDSILKEWSMYDSLIKASNKCIANGMEINQTILDNARKRQQRIADELDNLLK